MGVVSCKLQRFGRSGRIEGGEHILGLHTYSALYLVTTDDPTDDPLVPIYGAMGTGDNDIPFYRSVYDLGDSIDFSAFAQDYVAVQGDANHAKVWDVTVGWRPLPPGEVATYAPSGGFPFNDPLDKPDKHWVEQETYTREVTADVNGKAILNAAGHPYPDSPTVKEYRREVYCWIKRFATAGEIRTLNRAHALTVNETSFIGYAPGRALCWPILSSRVMNQDGSTFYEATIRVSCQQHTWQEVKQELGYKHWVWSDVVGDSGVRIMVEATDSLAAETEFNQVTEEASGTFFLDRFQPVSSPVPLIADPARPELKGFREYQLDAADPNKTRVWNTTWDKYPASELNDLMLDIPT